MPPPGGRRGAIDVGRQFLAANQRAVDRYGNASATGTPADQERYGWGSSPTLYGGQDLGTRFAQQFQASGGLFSPSFPLVPVEPELARLWDYPVGYNYIYTPRSYEPISFEELRALANNETLTRTAIETRKDQIEKLEWQIKPIDEKNVPDPKSTDKRILELTKLWRKPDGERPFAGWLRESIEDMLVIDAPAFEVLVNRDGSVRGYDIVDGSTIKVLIDITGRRPTAPAPAYQQVIHGRPWRLFAEDELIYVPRNKRPGHVYGFSPVEQILTFINIILRRQTTQLYWFSEGNLPQGFMSIPELNADQVARLQQYWDDRLAGNLAERSKFMPLPYGAKWQAVKQPPLKDDFDEWLARVVMFAFSLPPDAFVKQRSRATSETARQTALEEGLMPMMLWVKRIIDGEIQGRLGSPDLEFAWADIKDNDPEVQQKIEAGYVIRGMKTVDEARDTMGLDPLDGGIGSQPFIVAGNQVIMLKDVEAISAQAAAPPPPPVLHPVAGPQAPGVAGPTRPAPDGGGGPANGRGGATAPGDARHGARSDDPAADKPAKKAALKTLIVKRPLKNAAELIGWAKTQGFISTLKPEDMHVTVAYSRQPVDWTAAGDHFDELRSGNPDGRSVQSLGDQGAVVLKFSQPELYQRWQQFLDVGASWDYNGYYPHVTITYDGAPFNLSAIEPFAGELVFGPEIYDEIDDDWKDSIDERVIKNVGHPRATAPRPGARPGADAGRRAALDREARQLLRRHRAARVDGDLREARA